MAKWIRVRDNQTGDEFDINERSVRPGLTVLDDYPENTGRHPRPAKIRRDKDGNRAAFDAPDAADEPTVDRVIVMNPEVPTDPAEASPADNTEEQK